MTEQWTMSDNQPTDSNIIEADAEVVDVAEEPAENNDAVQQALFG